MRTRSRDLVAGSIGLSARVAVPEAAAGVDAAGAVKVHEGIPGTGGLLDPVRSKPYSGGNILDFSGGENNRIVAAIAGTNYRVLSCTQQCPPGYVWEVAALAVSAGTTPVDTTQTATGLYVFSSGAEQDYSITAWRDTFAALPAVRFYGARQFVVYGGHRIVVLVAGAGATVNYSFRGTALQRVGGKPLALVAGV